MFASRLCVFSLALACLTLVFPQPAAAQMLAGPAAAAAFCGTYLGGGPSGDPFREPANAVAVDLQGHIYLAGMTPATDFPLVNPIHGDRPTFDGFVAKLSSDCSQLIYATYLGGSGQDAVNGLVVDRDGNAYVTGKTSSTDFPTLNAFQPSGHNDAFVAKLSPTGTLLFSTYLGGANLDAGHDIAVDAAGNIYVTGSTSSLDFPTKNPIQGPHFIFNGASSDAFVAKFAADGRSLLFSTYLGGSGLENLMDSAIAVAPNGDVVVTGETRSTDMQVVNPVQAQFNGGVNDAFVARINAAGTGLIYWTYLGGRGDDQGLGVAVGADETAYVGGDTTSADFPVLNAHQATYGGQTDGFFAALDPEGRLLASSFLGGKNADSVHAVTAGLDEGSAYLAGETFSRDFPVIRPWLTARDFWAPSAFVARIVLHGRGVQMSTLIGGGEGDGIAVRAGAVLVAGETGATNLPISPNAYQKAPNGRSDAFVVQLVEISRTYLPLLWRSQ